MRDGGAPSKVDDTAQKHKVDASKLQTSRNEMPKAREERAVSKPSPVQVEKRVGRNDACPCGSGKKYKACHGKID